MPRRFSGGPPPRPPWWPEGEPWPPNHRPRRGALLGRLFVILGLALIGLIIVASAILSHMRETIGTPGPDGPPRFIGPLLLLFIGTLAFLVIRKIVRSFRPLTELADAAQRVTEGDYSVRVTPRGRDVSGMVVAFNTMTARLEQNEQQRQRLLADIAHELRTPVSVVQGTVEAMLDDVYPLDRAHLAPILDQTHAIARLLEDLQTLATTEAGTLSLHRSRSDIDELVGGCASSFTPVASKKGVKLRVEAASHAELDVDPIRIRQVIDNLLTNAIRYTPAGGEIVVGTVAASDMVEISVSDTGQGMAPTEVAKMFDRFVKSADSGGSGLGLAIARGLVQAHGGTIAATSNQGRGTTVTITLPRRIEV